MSLTIDQVLAHRARQTAPVKAFGGEVFVRSLSCGEMLDLSARLDVLRKQIEGDESVSLKIFAEQLSAYLSDASGAKACTVDQAEQIVRLQDRKDVVAVINAGAAHNAWSNEGQEEARKNS